ncbi:transporter substrate-binding domain-containing protein [Rhodonellum sp.]|uniref:transporter substrate-binding domain-containing protein n=1 Tax=Rhodonellum sp. TaxID=2231180 RepID=UPI0027208220|nr:transporter substrate-binding domain-containing protein [Rhodonellum sp.]MDO9552435.1 transporter substrate-binding domain-containing protein [Rhodonellum sp.]
MKKPVTVITIFLIFAIFGVQCTFFEREAKKDPVENSVLLDLDAIKKRGFIRAIVDNSSTSYYIYRGRRMGYEFEMLRNLAKELGVRLHLIVKSDIEEAFISLNEGKADIIAMNLEKTEERLKLMKFTKGLGEMSTVLVQNRRKNKIDRIEDLAERVIHVQKGSVYKSQLCALENPNALSFSIIEASEDEESLIDKVLQNEIDFTVVDKNVALVNATYHDELDVSLEISEASEVAWAIRKNSPELERAINEWIDQNNKSSNFDILYQKYFLNSKNSYFRNNSPFSSLAGNKISEYDDLIKKGAETLGWDWRLLASLVYKESRFDTTATSYAGAVGLLQLMPVTLERFGVENPNDPMESLMGGVNFLRYLDKFWRERVPETNERIKFILASYNIGHGHVEDAWKLTRKYGKNTQTWNNVAHYLSLKSDPKFYRDPIVRSGFAKGHIAVSYVTDVMITYDSYRVLVNP